ncbi:MAG TPA: competence protein, partial [Sphingobacteriaceae bacterium]|nr:competence protein [Sphingobacteriaceae bacterium]
PYTPSEFNYKAYLADHGIYHQTFINGDQVRLLDHKKGNAFIDFSFRLREKLVLKFNKYIPGNDAASVASTLILGYRADLSKEILDAYSKTGTMHVLSVSGMHVSIVFIVMAFMLKFMDRSKRLKLIRAALIIILIWFYAIITGYSAAACRAALMLSFVIIGKASQRKQNTYNLLAISAVLLLIYNPFFLFDVGFQLSYLAVIGLVYLYPKLYHLFYVRNWLGDQIWSYLSLSTAAQLATFPLSMYYFHQFPIYFLLSNLFIVLPVTIIMYAGLIFLFIPWDVLLIPLGWLLNKSINFTNLGLLYIEDLPFANISGIWINTWTYLLIYVLMLT